MKNGARLWLPISPDSFQSKGNIYTFFETSERMKNLYWKQISHFSGEKRLNDPVKLEDLKEPAAKKKKIKNDKKNRKSSAF